MPLPLLNESRVWIGYWWLPDFPDDRVPGRLMYEPDTGLRLELIGGWEHRNLTEVAAGMTVVHPGLRSWSVVYGESVQKRITLIDTQAVHASSTLFGSGKPDVLHLVAGTALIGCHLDGPDKADFMGVAATIENMTAWSRLSGLQIREDLDGDRFSATGDIHHERVPSQVATFGSVTAELHQLLTFPNLRTTRGGTTGEVDERFSVEFTSGELRSMRDWLAMLWSMGDLVSLSTLSACGVITIHLLAPATPEAYPKDYPGADRPHQVEVYQRRIVTPDPEQKGADQRDFILTLNDLPFSDLIPRWMEVKDRFSAARSMILGLRYVTAGYLETQVVTAVGAAESMHRALDLAPPMTAADFAALKRKLIDAAPDGRRQWVRERVGRNEPTLKSRLIELAERPGAFMSKLVPDPDKWATAAAGARNKLAHLGQTDAHSFQELNAVVEVTAAVVVMNLLSELGVPEDRLAVALHDHSGLSLAVSLAADHFSPEGHTTDTDREG